MKSIFSIILFSFIFTTSFSQCTDLFISEYLEGYRNNKAIEIYNPTPNPIDLSNYLLKRYSNGSQTASETMTLSGTIAAYDVVVAMNGQEDSVWVSDGAGYWSYGTDPAFRVYGDLFDALYPAVMYFNGNDAITLETLSGAIIDIVGKVGEDPGNAWTDDASAGYTDANGGSWWTKNHGLIRKWNITEGITQNPVSFNPTLEWDSLPDNIWTNLGSHTCGCDPTNTNIVKSNPIKIYPNPSNQGFFIVKSDDQRIQNLQLFNALGQEIFSNDANGTFVKIDISQFPKGIILVKSTLDNGETNIQKILSN